MKKLGVYIIACGQFRPLNVTVDLGTTYLDNKHEIFEDLSGIQYISLKGSNIILILRDIGL